MFYRGIVTKAGSSPSASAFAKCDQINSESRFLNKKRVDDGTRTHGLQGHNLAL
jgi:hypothetical protein